MLSNDRQVALNTGDRVVVTLPDGSQQVIKDENALLYRPGSNVQTETFQDGSTRSTVAARGWQPRRHHPRRQYEHPAPHR